MDGWVIPFGEIGVTEVFLTAPKWLEVISTTHQVFIFFIVRDICHNMIGGDDKAFDGFLKNKKI
jgi:hypothetical protein